MSENTVIKTRVVHLGDKVEVECDGKRETYWILRHRDDAQHFPNMGDATVISAKSPVAQSLLGREVGEVVSLVVPGEDSFLTEDFHSHMRQLQIIKIGRNYEQASE